jgi:hypothetical protein
MLVNKAAFLIAVYTEIDIRQRIQGTAFTEIIYLKTLRFRFWEKILCRGSNLS